MTITNEQLTAYRVHLRAEERSAATVAKYLHDATAFAAWLDDGVLTKEAAADWKHELLRRGQAPASINAALAALNGLFRFLGREDCRVKFLKVQRRAFRDESRELSQGEYTALVNAARSRGRARLALLIETIGGTGVRVSEVAYITAEAASSSRTCWAIRASKPRAFT